MYADKSTKSMERAIAEMERRRTIQLKHNEEHGIVPKSIQKALRSMLQLRSSKKRESEELLFKISDSIELKGKSRKDAITELKKKMLEAAKNLEFEKAAVYRDKITELEQTGITIRENKTPTPKKRGKGYRKRT
jgi:excinuclease ABC subunit B